MLEQEGGPLCPRRVSDEELLAGALHARIERWLELEGVFTILGFGEVELRGELDWEPGYGQVYLRRLDDGQVWRADITVTARPGRARGDGRLGALEPWRPSRPQPQVGCRFRALRGAFLPYSGPPRHQARYSS